MRLNSVHKEYRVSREVVVPALNGVSFDVHRGEFLAITGPSGSGKSTLLNILGILDEPTSGEIFFDGHEVHTFSEKERVAFRLKSISFVFQFFNLIENYTALENIMFQLQLQRYGFRESKKKAEEIIDFLGLKERSSFFPHELSGGEQQRVAIGRALAKDSLLLLADEPTAHLDSKNGELIIRLLHDINRSFGKTVVLVTHEKEEAQFADRDVVFRDGKVADIIKNNPDRPIGMKEIKVV